MKRTKIIGAIIGITVFTLMIAGLTYAFYRSVLFNDLKVDTVTPGLDYYINYAKGNDITSGTLNAGSDYTSGNSADIELWKKDNTYDIYGHIYLDVNEIGSNLANESALKYVLVNNGTVISRGSLKGSKSGDSILIGANIPLSTTKQLYTVYIWLDESMNSDLNIEGESLSISVRCEATMKTISVPERAVRLITKLYNSAPKTVVTNNNIEYNYASSVNLMNDRLGGTTTSLNGGNIRYYGANPSNYIYFNCDDYSNQSASTCELWRIIGVFGDKVKIMKNSSIGSLAWDYGYNKDGVSTTRVNDWTNASLKTLLNGVYYNNQDTTYYSYDYTNNVTITQTVNFNTNKTGIKNNATRNMISEVTWNLGGWDTAAVYSNEVYGYERGTKVYSGRPTTWKGKIALAYPSDYGYAGDFNYCTTNLYKYYDYEAYQAGENPSTLCRENDWMYTGYWYWLLTPHSSSTETEWYVGNYGHVNDWFGVGNAGAVQPVLYLTSNVTIESGNVGTSSDPYRINVS